MLFVISWPCYADDVSYRSVPLVCSKTVLAKQSQGKKQVQRKARRLRALAPGDEADHGACRLTARGQKAFRNAHIFQSLQL